MKQDFDRNMVKHKSKSLFIFLLILLAACKVEPTNLKEGHKPLAKPSTLPREIPTLTNNDYYSVQTTDSVSILSSNATLNVSNSSTSPFLDELTQNTWEYLSSDWATDNHLPWSWRSETLPNGDFANTAEIGLYALSWLAAYDMEEAWSPTWDETESEVTAVLDQLRAWQIGSQSEQPHGPNAYNNSVFYQWYWINWDPPVVGANTDLNQLVPSIDNAWLALSLIAIREYAEINNHSLLAQKADDILSEMDFTLWYNNSTHLFYWGDIQNPKAGSIANVYSNENRIINFTARALGQLSAKEFQRSLDALMQNPGTYDSITVEKVAWDGSYFTYASPALFIREMDSDYGINTILPASLAQIAYASDQGYEVWGLSDSYDVEDRDYVQQGALPTEGGLAETRPGLITPHAVALTLITPTASSAIVNLQAIYNTYPCAYHAKYGFIDSVMTKLDDPDYGKCSFRFTALAQEWIFLSLANYKSGFIWKYLYRDNGVLQAHEEMYGSVIYLPISRK